MTRKCAKALLPFITAYAEGKTIQVYDTVEQKWFDVGGDSGYTTSFAEHPASYRIKPEPKLVPMTSDDFPPVFWICRTKQLPGPVSSYFVTAVCSDNGLVASAGFTVQMEEMHEWSWSEDRKAWASCMKEATE